MEKRIFAYSNASRRIYGGVGNDGSMRERELQYGTKLSKDRADEAK
jgi:hypothetical protein